MSPRWINPLNRKIEDSKGDVLNMIKDAKDNIVAVIGPVATVTDAAIHAAARETELRALGGKTQDFYRVQGRDVPPAHAQGQEREHVDPQTVRRGEDWD